MKPSNEIVKTSKKAIQAMRRAVIKLIKERKLLGESLSMWKNGKIIEVPAKKIDLAKLGKNIKAR